MGNLTLYVEECQHRFKFNLYIFLVDKKEYQIIYYRYEDSIFIVCDEDQATHKFYDWEHELTKLGIKKALDKFAKKVKMLGNKGGNNEQV